MKGFDFRGKERFDKASLILSLLLAMTAAVQFFQYLFLEGYGLLMIVLYVVSSMLVLFLAERTRLFPLHLLNAAGSFVFLYRTVYLETTLFNIPFGITCGLSVISFFVLGFLFFHDQVHFRFQKWQFIPLSLLLAIVFSSSLSFGISISVDRGQDKVQRQLFAVPSCLDDKEAEHKGRVETLSYRTRAYATDERNVTKECLVYLPYGYDEEKEYDILYLLHGTGDDERYWLETFPENKVLLDRMIEEEIIDPLLVVTPTFYVEEDCLANLDLLTYSFAEELRNDLMPAVEGKYSTYAATIDEEGFSQSRRHRAFAGLSRGAVTMYRSAMIQSMDYFSWFGAFSASRIPFDRYEEEILETSWKDLPIDLLYVASGTMDFSYPNQIQDYKTLKKLDDRLVEGQNLFLDVFPMKTHSMANWHLALYNLLQHLF